MKADHRHELKTNELAEWIANLPQWAKENRTTIIVVGVAIAVVGGLYFRYFYRKNVVAVRRQLKLTGLFNQLSVNKLQIVQARSQGRDLSFILLQPADNLQTFAQNTKNQHMAALALIKRAEALRTELHYRLTPPSQQDLMTQISKARASYQEAFETASSVPSLRAMAQFGLGLCEEELDNYEQARQIYRDIVANAEFEGTTARVSAQYRLDTMADYETKGVFKPSPKPAPIPPLLPPGEMGPGSEVNLPLDINLPFALEPVTEAPNLAPVVPDTNLIPTLPTGVPDVTETNLPGK